MCYSIRNQRSTKTTTTTIQCFLLQANDTSPLQLLTLISSWRSCYFSHKNTSTVTVNSRDKQTFSEDRLQGLGELACERRRISGCHLVPPKNNICEPVPENDFCDVMTFVCPWPIRFHDNEMKLECSSQRIPRAVVLGLFELNCDWLRIPTSQKSFSGAGSQMLFFGGTKWQPEIRLRSQARKRFLWCRNFKPITV